jgi:hypothetical protein
MLMGGLSVETLVILSLWSKLDTALTSAGDCSKPVALPRTPQASHQARDNQAIAKAARVTPEPQKSNPYNRLYGLQ